MFRKLYWVTEEISRNGQSQVTGIYTSIPDLCRRGLRWVGTAEGAELRLTLAKLDCDKAPLGCWTSPSFDGLKSGLQQFVLTDEFSEDQCKMLLHDLESFASVSV